VHFPILSYTLNRLEGNAFVQISPYIDTTTNRLTFTTLNELIEVMETVFVLHGSVCSTSVLLPAADPPCSTTIDAHPHPPAMHVLTLMFTYSCFFLVILLVYRTMFHMFPSRLISPNHIVPVTHMRLHSSD